MVPTCGRFSDLPVTGNAAARREARKHVKRTPIASLAQDLCDSETLRQHIADFQHHVQPCCFGLWRGRAHAWSLRTAVSMHLRYKFLPYALIVMDLRRRKHGPLRHWGMLVAILSLSVAICLLFWGAVQAYMKTLNNLSAAPPPPNATG